MLQIQRKFSIYEKGTYQDHLLEYGYFQNKNK